MIVGITGNYCSGKDLACRVFEQVGFSVIERLPKHSEKI